MTSKNERKFIQCFLILSSCSFCKHYELLSAGCLNGMDSFVQTKKRLTSMIIPLVISYPLCTLLYAIIFYDCIDLIRKQACTLHCICRLYLLCLRPTVLFFCYVLGFKVGVIFVQVFCCIHFRYNYK